jgi:hypothetical protein
VSHALLDVGENPTDEQIRQFEDISFTLRTSNGTYRTTFRQRFHDVDAVAMRCMERFYPPESELLIQDRAVSNGLTSWEWAQRVFAVYPRTQFEASDILLYLVRLTLADGAMYIAEPDGHPLQYIKPPFVVSVEHREPLRYPLNHLVAAWARRRFRRLALPEGWTETSGGTGYQVKRISCMHPQALRFSREHPGFQLRARSVFNAAPDSCHVLRTMNIFNEAYFSMEQLAVGAAAAFDSLMPGGLWIVGRTLEEDSSNHATVFRRGDSGWEVLERVGAGWELEKLALGGASR